jgi:hypothetical protein
VSAYGAAKAAAEVVVTARDPRAVIVRTSWIVGDGRSGFEQFVAAKMLARAGSCHFVRLSVSAARRGAAATTSPAVSCSSGRSATVPSRSWTDADGSRNRVPPVSRPS